MEAFPSQDKHTIVTAVLFLPIPHKESRNGVLKRENLPVPFRRSPPEFMSPSSTPTTFAFVEQPISLRVSVRFQRTLIYAFPSIVV
jgi:hypothetical protein